MSCHQHIPVSQMASHTAQQNLTGQCPGPGRVFNIDDLTKETIKSILDNFFEKVFPIDQ